MNVEKKTRCPHISMGQLVSWENFPICFFFWSIRRDFHHRTFLLQRFLHLLLRHKLKYFVQNVVVLFSLASALTLNVNFVNILRIFYILLFLSFFFSPMKSTLNHRHIRWLLVDAQCAQEGKTSRTRSNNHIAWMNWDNLMEKIWNVVVYSV